MISKEEVQHIAKLARLELTEKEIEKMQKDLSAILDYFELLKRAPKVKIQNPTLNTQHPREDEIISSHDIADELIGQAPDKKDDYIKVKNIF
ncbi:MAG: Asp-tRNA(Asn)/Glu-tRNA(Gln) amidotransferase subunit GatC [Candidatus Staskawiczbacteria bacterium]|jgi:aspartyl/glutamyl-tRNA(Asn/Gln) amidotransferase C subunit